MSQTPHKKLVRLSKEFFQTREAIVKSSLNTVCIEANCPNMCECFAKKRATFLIMGRTCTRSCSYCALPYTKKGEELDFGEIERVLELAALQNLNHIILTSITRDDLSDGGSGYFARAANFLKENISNATIEILTPDFGYQKEAIANITSCKADTLSHNIELAEPLFKKYRSGASYQKSLLLLAEYARCKPTKSGFMVGFGESEYDILKTVEDLASSGVSMLSIGHYLAPKDGFVKPKNYYTQEWFERLEEKIKTDFSFKALNIGIYSRSSYMDCK